MTIQITVGNNMKRERVLVEDTATLKSVLEQADIDYASGNGVTTLDGAPLQAGELNKTFADFGVTEKATLIRVVKADNA